MDSVYAPPGTCRFPISRSGISWTLLFLLLSPSAAIGQTLPDRIQDFLESASGFSLLGSVHEGTLSAGQELVVSVSLLERGEYMVVGYCDDACTNLDLTLFDPSRQEIQSDRLPDSEPILTLTAETTGQYFIKVDVVDCAADSCGFAIGVLGSTDEPGASPGQDMGARLTLVGAELTALGFTEVGREMRGSLNSDQAVSVPVQMEEGQEYRMAGVCDVDCLDLDLVLYDPSGVEVDSDVLEDALPILAYVPDTTAVHQVEVIMIACEVEPCAYRIATYAKGEDVGPGGTPLSGEMVSFVTHQGELARSDERSESGAYLDHYEVEAKAGQRIVVDLRSDEFDTLLRVKAPGGEEEENDDYGLETGHSHVEMIALEDGVYAIQVTSFDPGSEGGYVLQIAVVD